MCEMKGVGKNWERQYKDASNLQARLGLYGRFSTNKDGWSRWVFEQFDLPPESAILELGCGNAGLWVKNVQRIPEGWRITLTDISPGMLKVARHNLREVQHPFQFKCVDAASIPFSDTRFDAVIANHMLYYQLDMDKTLSEISRVLQPHGCLYASTLGQKHLHELKTLVKSIIPSISRKSPSGNFSLENGGEKLSKWFRQVSIHYYEDTLIITEVDPVIAYFQSTQRYNSRQLTKIRHYLEAYMKDHGHIRVSTNSGLFKAHKEARG